MQLHVSAIDVLPTVDDSACRSALPVQRPAPAAICMAGVELMGCRLASCDVLQMLTDC